MSRPVCTLAAALPGGGWAGLARHRAYCLACQAAAARGRSLQRDLAALAAAVPAPPTLHAAVTSRLGVQDAADPFCSLAARAAARYAATAGVAVAALAALATGLARRHSRALG